MGHQGGQLHACKFGLGFGISWGIGLIVLGLISRFGFIKCRGG